MTTKNTRCQGRTTATNEQCAMGACFRFVDERGSRQWLCGIHQNKARRGGGRLTLIESLDPDRPIQSFTAPACPKCGAFEGSKFALDCVARRSRLCALVRGTP